MSEDVNVGLSRERYSKTTTTKKIPSGDSLRYLGVEHTTFRTPTG